MSELPIADLSLTESIPCGVFERVQVQTNPLGGNVIVWGVEAAFAKRGPFHFYVDFGRPGTNEWESLNKIPVIDDCMFIDPCQRHWDNQIDYFYRVRVVLVNEQDENGDCPVFASQPQAANGLWDRSDWLIAREILRKEWLLRKKRTNKTSPGLILKRRRFGTVSQSTREFDTSEIVHTKSEVDFGTGFIGGYFPGVDASIILDAPWDREIKMDKMVGTRRDVIRSGRAIAYPYIETGDIWVRRDNGERYLVNGIKTVAELGGIPLIQSLELRLAPVTDIIYRVPLDGSTSSSSSSSSSSSEEICDWRTGLATDASW